MARARKHAAAAAETATEDTARPSAETVEASPKPPAAGDGPAQQALDTNGGPTDANHPASPARKPIVTPDPRGIMSIELGDTKGSPRVQLRRSYQYRQMQIAFEQQPDDITLGRLKQAGWTDRTEQEGIWTKQIDKDAVWQSIEKMEREFKEIANAIRKDKGLEPMMQGPSAA